MSEETYQLADEHPAPPPLPGTVVTRDSKDTLIDVLGSDLLGHAFNCVRAFGDFHLALSGGSTPEPFYKRLMYDPPMRGLPWNKTHLWIVDERRVGFDDEKSNFKTIREIICDHSDIPPEQVHPMVATAEDADTKYEHELREHLGWREKGHDRLDFVLLGMGDDAHTASLFPRSAALESGDRLVMINSGPEVTPPDRVTMTYKLINASRFIAVLVTGEKKRATIAKVAEAGAKSNKDIARYPILGVEPVGGVMRWYLDGPACPGWEPVGD